MRFKRKYINYMIIILLVFADISYVNAANSSKNLDLDFRVVDKCVQTTLDKNKKGLKIKYDNDEAEKNPYIQLYKSGKYNWTKYDAIVLQVENKEDKPINIGIQIENKSNVKFKLQDNGVVFLKKDKTKSYIQAKQNYSNVEIPSKFKGRVYIKFNNLINEKNNKKLKKSQLKNITYWGITIVPTKEGKGEVILNKAELWKNKDLVALNKLRDIEVVGSNEVQIPMIGESIERYKVKGKKNVVFSLQKEVEGVSISKDGLLSINNKVNQEYLILNMKIKDKIILKKYISLKHPWYRDKFDEQNVSYGLPSPTNSPTVNAMSKFSVLENSFTFVKTFLVVVFIMTLVLYKYWSNSRNKTT